jgi:hypothetical protein
LNGCRPANDFMRNEWLEAMKKYRLLVLIAACSGIPAFGQPCTRGYDSVSAQALACFRTTGPQHGINLAAGTSGSISARGGGNGTFTWAAASSVLTLSVDHLPAWASCADATREFDDFVNACKKTDTVAHVSTSPAQDVWRIDSPNVLQLDTTYTQIRFAPLDHVEVEAGGCDQNGGHGDTWRRYLNPANDTQHHGLVLLPGFATFRRIMDVAGPARAVTLPGSISGDSVLHLGFESGNFSAGGYWGRDPGPNRECVGQPNAWVTITIVHHRTN